jgi:heme exporter protein D
MNIAFIWSSWSDFIAMGGYGLYVWGSFGLAALTMICEVASLRSRRRALLRQVLRQEPDALERSAFGEAQHEG